MELYQLLYQLLPATSEHVPLIFTTSNSYTMYGYD